MTTKEKILEVATELFARNGYSNTSIREIARLVEITEGAIYRHYSSKSEILDAIIEKFNQTYPHFLMSRKQIDALMDICTPRQLLDTFVQYRNRDEQEFMFRALKILFREEVENLELRELVNVVLFNYFASQYKYILDELAKRDGIPKLDTASLSLLWAQVLMTNTLKWTASFPDQEASKQVAEEYLTISYLLVEMAVTGQAPLETEQRRTSYRR